MRIKLDIKMEGWSWKKIKRNYEEFRKEVKRQLNQKFPEVSDFRIIRITGNGIRRRGSISVKTVEVEVVTVNSIEVEETIEKLEKIKNRISEVQRMLIARRYEASSELRRITSEIKEIIYSISM